MGCFPLPPVVPLSQAGQRSTQGERVAIQLPESAQKRLREATEAEKTSHVQLRTIAIQKRTVLFDKEVSLPPKGKALW